MKKNLLKLMALGVFAVSAAVAQVPATFNFQGRLTDAKNNPITTTVDVTFEIYDVPNGGTPLHTEVMTITPDNGLTCNSYKYEPDASSSPFDLRKFHSIEWLPTSLYSSNIAAIVLPITS